MRDVSCCLVQSIGLLSYSIPILEWRITRSSTCFDLHIGKTMNRIIPKGTKKYEFSEKDGIDLTNSSSAFKPIGVIPPMITPFRGDAMSELDLEKLDILTDFIIEKGVHGLMPLGTSSEFALLTPSERKVFVRRVVERARKRVPIIAGVSDPGTKNVLDYAKQAEKDGVDAVICTGPYYYRTNNEGLLSHFQTLIDAISIPIMIYNIPAYVGYNIPPEVVQKLAETNPGRVAGVKFTTNDLTMFLEYLRLMGETMQIMIGSDTLFFSALELGAAGGILGSANVLPEETSSIFNLFLKGDILRAKSIQREIEPFTYAMGLGTFPAAVKEAMRLIGLDCGDVRPPLVSLSEREKKMVRASLSFKLHG